MKCSYVVYKYTKHENVNCHCKLGHIELLECLHYSQYHIWDMILFSHLCSFIFIKARINKNITYHSIMNCPSIYKCKGYNGFDISTNSRESIIEFVMVQMNKW